MSKKTVRVHKKRGHLGILLSKRPIVAGKVTLNRFLTLYSTKFEQIFNISFCSSKILLIGGYQTGKGEFYKEVRCLCGGFAPGRSNLIELDQLLNRKETVRRYQLYE